MLSLDAVSVRYGAVEAVRGVSIRLQPGEVVALVGSNGAGKSSILKAVLGLVPAAGAIRLEGRAIEGLATHDRVAAGVALSPEGRQVFPDMTVRDNLELGFKPKPGLVLAERIALMVDLFPRLGERLDQRAGSMSGGEQQMVAIGRALMSAPKVLMLDEPTLGLAPIVVDQITALLWRLKAQGLAVLLAEQNAEMALSSSDRAYVLETGSLTGAGASAELLGNPAIREAYLGM
ncbi:ABC transporter ATP-binding protein [Azospirillum endophyticum]